MDRGRLLKDNNLRTRSSVFGRNFKSRLNIRTYMPFGEINSDIYVGGCTFVNNMGFCFHIEYQFAFSGFNQS